jgi:hypothetical protein
MLVLPSEQGSVVLNRGRRTTRVSRIREVGLRAHCTVCFAGTGTVDTTLHFAVGVVRRTSEWIAGKGARHVQAMERAVSCPGGFAPGMAPKSPHGSQMLKRLEEIGRTPSYSSPWIPAMQTNRRPELAPRTMRSGSSVSAALRREHGSP